MRVFVLFISSIFPLNLTTPYRRLETEYRRVELYGIPLAGPTVDFQIANDICKQVNEIDLI